MLPPYTQWKRGKIIFSKRIPADLAHHYAQTHIKRSCRTSDPKVAARLASQWNADLERQFAELRMRTPPQLVPHVALPEVLKTPQEALQWQQQALTLLRKYSELLHLTGGDSDNLEAVDNFLSRTLERVYEEGNPGPVPKDLASLLVNIQDEVSPAPVGPSLLDLCRDWAVEHRPTLRTLAETEQILKGAAKVHPHGRSGDLPASLLSQGDVIRYKQALVKEGLHPTTIRKRLSLLGTILRYGKRNGHLERIATEGVMVPGKKDTERPARRSLSDRELTLLLTHTGTMKAPTDRLIPLLLAAFGVRLEEACQLTVNDVDLQSPIPTLRIGDQGGGRVKTAGSRRLLPIPEYLRPVLEGHLGTLKEGETRLFPSLRPNRYGQRGSAWGKHFGRLLRELGFPPEVVGHSLRHTFATRCRAVGVPRDVVMALMGHTEGDVHGRYGDMPLTVLKEAMERLPALPTPATAGDKLPPLPLPLPPVG